MPPPGTVIAEPVTPGPAAAGTELPPADVPARKEKRDKAEKDKGSKRETAKERGRSRSRRRRAKKEAEPPLPSPLGAPSRQRRHQAAVSNLLAMDFCWTIPAHAAPAFQSELPKLANGSDSTKKRRT